MFADADPLALKHQHARGEEVRGVKGVWCGGCWGGWGWVKLCALTRPYGGRERFARKLWLANCADSSFHNRLVHFHLGALLDAIVRGGRIRTRFTLDL